MARSDAMDRAIKKYEQEKVDRIIFRVPKGMKEQIQLNNKKKGTPYQKMKYLLLFWNLYLLRNFI